MLKLHVVNSGKTEKGIALKPGMIVDYCGHLPGGNVLIQIDGKDDTANSKCFKEFQ